MVRDGFDFNGGKIILSLTRPNINSVKAMNVTIPFFCHRDRVQSSCTLIDYRSADDTYRAADIPSALIVFIHIPNRYWLAERIGLCGTRIVYPQRRVSSVNGVS